MNYRMIEGADAIDVREVSALLKTSYWANQRSDETIEKSMRNSSCFGIYSDDEKKLIGFIRVISDFATTFYLCDLIIDPVHRRQGLGKALVSHVLSKPEYKGLRGLLMTGDAHGLYEKFGFERVSGKAMEKRPG